MTSTYKGLREVVTMLGDNGPNEPLGVDAETAASALALIDLLEFASATPPKIFWHGGDAIVLTWGEGEWGEPDKGSDKMMITLSGDGEFSVLHAGEEWRKSRTTKEHGV